MVRWFVAVLVTVAAFAIATWICGALILPMVMKDGGVRWGIAVGVGVATAALAALWGHSFATVKHSREPAHLPSVAEPTTAVTGPGDTYNKISGGTFHQPVIQGRDISGSGTDTSIAPPTTGSSPQD